MPADTGLPPLDAGPDEWGEHWFEKTTITVDRYVKARLDHDRDGKPWNEYLEELRQAKADPVTLSDAQAIADYLQAELTTPPQDGKIYATVSGFDADGEHNLRAILKDMINEGAFR